jgi:uncharacterized protein YcbK (DUF882 family)
MKVRVLGALVCATLMSVFASAAQARVESSGSEASSYSTKSGSLSKPRHTKYYKSSNKKSYASSSKAKRYTNSSRKKRYYASGKRSSRYANRAITAGRGEGGTSRSCLQSSARALLSRIESRFGSVNIISTCRAGATIATSGKPSKHRFGLAIDFSAPGRKAAVVQWLIANHHSGGTMTYRDMDHIHVDVGYHFVSLGANSGRG